MFTSNFFSGEEEPKILFFTAGTGEN